jgi:hypothetical protein
MTLGLLAVMALLASAAAAIFWPLLRAHHNPRPVQATETALTVARDAKLGELNDLELDFRLGKLSAADYGELNTTLRAEAVEIMREIDDRREHAP